MWGFIDNFGLLSLIYRYPYLLSISSVPLHPLFNSLSNYLFFLVRFFWFFLTGLFISFSILLYTVLLNHFSLKVFPPSSVVKFKKVFNFIPCYLCNVNLKPHPFCNHWNYFRQRDINTFNFVPTLFDLYFLHYLTFFLVICVMHSNPPLFSLSYQLTR